MIDVRNLSVDFHIQGKKLQAVRDVSFSIPEGKTVGIVGESGCGKSVTAKALVQLLPAHAHISGTISYRSKNLLNCSEKEMRAIRGKEIGMIFQDPMTSLNPTMKIGAQIIEGYLRHYPHLSREQARLRAIEILRLVKIPQPEERAEDYPHRLSGGMRQRVMIGLALAAPERKLLIADEPTTALDVTIQAQILDLMKEIQQKLQMSILLITHDMSVIANFCDHVLVMYAGKIVESGPVHDIFQHPHHPYTQKLLKAIPRLDWSHDHPLDPIEGRPPDLDLLPSGCAFAPRCPFATSQCEKQPPLFSVSAYQRSSCWRHSS